MPFSCGVSAVMVGYRRCDRGNGQLSRVVTCCITRSLYGSRPATPCDGSIGQLSLVDTCYEKRSLHCCRHAAVTAALVGYRRCDRINSRLSRVVTCCITRSLYGGRPATPCDGSNGQLSLIDTCYEKRSLHCCRHAAVTAALVGYRGL